MKIALIIVGLLALVYILNMVARKQMRNIPVVADHEKIVTLTDKNFQTQTKNKLVLVDFWASWCAPCRMMAPVLNDAAAELKDNARIGKVNIEENRFLAQKFKIRNIPTMVLFKDGVEVSRFTGVKNKEFLLRQIQNVQ
ncbi:MAG: thioredoxin [Bacteroidales bacterium]|nr:thioredoxin [Bacteroidales bacterium]MDD4712133.1 thioredoxin [Bacteroidales bacterium]